MLRLASDDDDDDDDDNNNNNNWPLGRHTDRSWWHRHTSIKLFLAAANGSMDEVTFDPPSKYCRFFYLN